MKINHLPKEELLDEFQRSCLKKILEISAIDRPGKDCGSNCMGGGLYIVCATDDYTERSSKETMPYLEKMIKDPQSQRFGDLIAWMTRERDHCFHLGIMVETERVEDPLVFSWGYNQKPEILFLSQINPDNPTISEYRYRPQPPFYK